MPRYYFDLPYQIDDLGAELADVSAARSYALRFTGELLSSVDPGDRGKDYWRVDISGEDRLRLFSIVVELTPAQPTLEGWFAGMSMIKAST
jgi:hypothetical protein